MARRETTGPVESGSPAGPTPPDPSTLGYEQARGELVSIVARLESGAGTLEESLALWERGEALAARCQQWLDGARERLTAARGATPSTAAGGPGTDDDDDEETR